MQRFKTFFLEFLIGLEWTQVDSSGQIKGFRGVNSSQIVVKLKG